MSPATPKSMAENPKEAQKASANTTCRTVRDEPVNGEAATLYNAHEQPDSKEDSQIWISKSRGAPLELETDMDSRGAAGKSHRVMRYEYRNVKAPSGIQ